MRHVPPSATEVDPQVPVTPRRWRRRVGRHGVGMRSAEFALQLPEQVGELVPGRDPVGEGPVTGDDCVPVEAAHVLDPVEVTLEPGGLHEHLRPLRGRVHRERGCGRDRPRRSRARPRPPCGRRAGPSPSRRSARPGAPRRRSPPPRRRRPRACRPCPVRRSRCCTLGLGVLVGIDPPLPELAGRWVLEPHQAPPGGRQPGQAPGRHGQVDEALGQPFRVDRDRSPGPRRDSCRRRPGRPASSGPSGAGLAASRRRR